MNNPLSLIRCLGAGLLLLCLGLSLSAQRVSLFTPAPAKTSTSAELERELTDFSLLSVDAEAYAQLAATAPTNQWELTLPALPGRTPALTLRLQPNELLATDFQLVAAADGKPVYRPDLGDHYAGEIAGQPGSRVALSLLDAELTATITFPNGDRLALGRLQSEAKGSQETTYVLFPEEQLRDKQAFDCGTVDNGLPYLADELTPRTDKSTAGCVDVYFEIDFDIFSDKGSVQAAAQHLAANFNEVKVLYDAIGVNANISEVLVWDVPSPYVAQGTGNVLRQFQQVRTEFNGDVAQLIAYHNRGGVAVLDGLCHPLRAARMSFSGISPAFESVPVYSWSTMVIAHELGHLFGSRHTHACVWNGNGTAIDGCANTEGGCGRPAVPAGGGTIMSYCHLTAAGINFNYGFGAQPGALIANRIAAAQGCLTATCGTGGGNDGGNGGGGDNPDDDDDDDPVVNEEPFSCDAEPVYLTLRLDNFGMETTWAIRSETGDSLATGGPYPKKQAGRAVHDSICLPEGCYVFELTDDHGDGLCCTYGQGSFLLQDRDNNVLGSGAEFDTLTVTDFCLPDVPANDDDEPEDDPCAGIDFSETTIESYGGNQDVGLVSVIEDGEGLVLQNNAWKAVPFSYTVTPATWVSFWFRSTRRGEVHGIGLDNNVVLSADLTMRVYGTQNWGNGDYDNYAGNGEWQYYQIPIGQYYTLEAEYLFFTADHDVGTRDGNSFFRNVTVTEGAPCGPADLAGLTAPTSATGLHLSPNPTATTLRVELPEGQGDWKYAVTDLTGRSVLTGSGATGTAFSLDVSGLRPGAYVLDCTDGTRKERRRFVVAR